MKDLFKISLERDAYCITDDIGDQRIKHLSHTAPNIMCQGSSKATKTLMVNRCENLSAPDSMST